MSKKTLLIAAFLIGAGCGSAQAADSKVIPGYACQPQTTQIGDFLYQVGGLTNLSFTKQRVVVCPLEKDHNQNTADVANELLDVEVHVRRAASSFSNLRCTVRVRNLFTGAVVAANFRSDNTAPPANVRLDFDPLNAPQTTSGNGVRSTYDIVCIVPERATVRGVFWSEDDETDVNDAPV